MVFCPVVAVVMLKSRDASSWSQLYLLIKDAPSFKHKVWFLKFVRFEFLMAVKIPILVFCILTPFGPIYGCQECTVLNTPKQSRIF